MNSISCAIAFHDVTKCSNGKWHHNEDHYEQKKGMKCPDEFTWSSFCSAYRLDIGHCRWRSLAPQWPAAGAKAVER